MIYLSTDALAFLSAWDRSWDIDINRASWSYVDFVIACDTFQEEGNCIAGFLQENNKEKQEGEKPQK